MPLTTEGDEVDMLYPKLEEEESVKRNDKDSRKLMLSAYKPRKIIKFNSKVSPPLLGGGGSCSCESSLIPAGLPASTSVTALAALTFGNLHCRREPRGKVHTRVKIASQFTTQRQFLHRFQALVNPIESIYT